MKKIIIFLLSILSTLILLPKKTYASTFYEGEYAGNIYINKYDRNTKTTYYQRSRFFRETGTNEAVYCIEPFKGFSGGNYLGTTKNSLFNSELGEKIKAIAYFGYGYENHLEEKWYTATQVMIWKAIVNDNDIYFTQGLNGQRITILEEEMNEINNLIYEYYNKPNLKENYKVSKNNRFEIKDTNLLLNKYNVTSDINIKKDDNNITGIINDNNNHEIYLERNFNRVSSEPLFFMSPTSQAIFKAGILKNNLKININAIDTSIKLIKTDSEGIKRKNLTLKGAIYEIYKDEIYISQIQTNESGEAEISNLDFGNYKIKELSPPVGYKLDEKEYHVTISEITPNISIEVSDEVIKNEITINKTINNNEISLPEKNIEFEIYDDNSLITKIKTNELGQAKVILPYGVYRLHQLNSTPGYKLSKDITLIVEKETPETINIKDEIIKKKIIINKTYGSGNNFKPEKNISFNIYNEEGNIINTITTNELGYAEITLPYGKYTIKQLNSTYGYKEIDDLHIDIKDEIEKTYDLKDYLIPVPNTNKQKNYEFIILLIIITICLKYIKKLA